MAASIEPVFINSPLFKSIFENATANAIQFMDEEGYIIHVNHAFTTLFGYTIQDLAGKHTRVLFTEEDQRMKLPELEIEKVNQHKSAIDKNYLVHKDSSCVWVTGEAIMTTDDNGNKFIVKFIQSIHEQKLLEKVLKESTDFSQSVVRSISNALVVFDLNFRIIGQIMRSTISLT